ncbi:integrase core domain-containing protein [Botrimarina hoheduenensis]|uniref:Integrase core domain protein n=1 Tax=Botrimarina hoheduenensis TaxID=2528000 RepID=A0A5C5WFV1_9BACT|nr:integrase core domain-containing protein [Botrimarina hoheduenensis]TWT48969.1 Integrase core domain protein [Botrimarina hoheduenensis]
MTSWFSPLLFLLAGSTEQQLRRHVEFLKAENEMLRKRVEKSRVFLTNEEQARLLTLGEAIGKGVLDLITIVSPRTYQRWRRRVSQGEKPAKKMGRKGTPETLRQLVVRLAKENTWGYGRIVGELKKLRIQCVGRTTVRTILKEEGIHPGPQRGKGTWDEFIKIHAETLWQVDFFTKPVITATGLKQVYVLAFLHVRSRRVICSPATFHPDDAWMKTQAVAMLQQADAAELPIEHLVRDKDFKYREAFDGVFEAADVAVQATATRAPNQNAFIERWIGSIKGECLNRFIAFGLRHLDYLVEEYVRFYNERRPHSRKDNKPLVGVWSDLDDPPDDLQALVCEERLAGVLKHYERRVA